MDDIDVGLNLTGAEVEGHNWGTDGYTSLFTYNPANDAGIINRANLDLYRSSGSDIWIGLCYKTTGNNFKFRDSINLGALSAGSQTILGLSLDVETGDYAGCYNGHLWNYTRKFACKSYYQAGNCMDGAEHTFIGPYGSEALTLYLLGSAGSSGGSKAFMHHYRHIMAGGVGRQC